MMQTLQRGGVPLLQLTILCLLAIQHTHVYRGPSVRQLKHQRGKSKSITKAAYSPQKVQSPIHHFPKVNQQA